MQDQDKYTLTWHRYSDHLREALKEMMTSSEFADVTLVSDDKKQIRAHRNILSACSPVFKNILQLDSKNVNPVIYLRGIQHSEIESIMQFIYLGEAKFYEERIGEFIMVSKNLEIKEMSAVIEMNDLIASNEENSQQENYVVDDKNIGEEPASPPYESGVNVEHGELTVIRPTIRNKTVREQRAEGGKYDCNQFEQQFTLQGNLTKHEGVKYACNQCDYKAAQKGNLTQHIQSKHEGVKYDCNECDYQTTTPSNLTIHIQAKHEGVKHACNQCGKQFTMQKSLTRHIQSKHEGVKYACNQCDYTGAQKGNLTQHIESKHEGVKYTCNYCDHEANSKPALIYHAKSKHNN